MPTEEPNLKKSVERLKSLSLNIFKKSPKDVGEAYLAAVGLLVHLKKDQSTLHCRRSQNGEKSVKAPSNNEIPAMSAVMHDRKLFTALLRCLNSGGMIGGDAPTSIMSDSVPQSRKRAMSVSNEALSNKALKLTHSPMPGRKPVVTMDNRKTAHRTPTFKLPVLAATILYTAFAHLDHWPVPLVEAYAADCFGARQWVDDADCALLVENIALAHRRVESEANLSDEQQQDAAKVAEAYKGFCIDEATDAVDEQLGHVTQRRPSISSVASNTSSNHLGKNESLAEDPKQRHFTTKSKGNNSPPKKEKVLTTADDGNSSSSGEEEEESDVIMSESNDDESKQSKRSKEPPNRASSNGSIGEVVNPSRRFYPIDQQNLKLLKVRARYFGLNLNAAHDAISSALNDRIGQKSKQNSGLLQALPSFAAIPKVRVLVTENLEKWLQSPALAGLSRTLFSSAVDNMKNVDPPLEEDLKAIDFILMMKLKANQFSAHLENVAAIARKIPTATVANHMYSQLVKSCLAESTQTPSDDSLSMISAIHKTLPSHISYEAMAASLLMILIDGDDTDQLQEKKKPDQMKVVRQLRRFIRSLAAKLGTCFDGIQLLAALLELDVSEDKWSLKDEEDKARLMFQCVTIHVAAIAGHKDSSTSSNWKTLVKASGVEEKVRAALQTSRRMLLQWCCNDYGPSYNRKRKKKLDTSSLEEAITPDFVSAIGPDSQEESIPPWLNTMRCLLLIEDVDSALMTHFLSPFYGTGQPEEGWEEEKERIALCANFGADVDDEIIAVILKSSGIDGGGLSADMSVKLIEHLFESCGKRKGASLKVSDPDLVWELYKLAHYTPSQGLISLRIAEDKEEDGGHSDDFGALPRLAYTGLWWRVTILGLVMCGSNPERIGSVVWKDHPTLCGLIKMVTSTKYRFPTVDCDEVSRERMKQEEQTARDEETRVAELLFLPPKKKSKLSSNSKRAGSRVSRRLLKQQQEKEAAAELAETNRRKKLLRSAQKSIMLWDPDGPARKPPRESAELLVSAETLFGLSESFQRCTNPDFLLRTIGGTSRGAIERAYDWLIPIISRIPETISRLPSSTSCFLLLRAYGTDGERRTQLKELSTPLLHHVQDSLRGTLGEAESKEAFEILLADVASHHSERRKSARRVLHDALGSIMANTENSKPGVSRWMLNITSVEYAKSVVPIAMARLATAAKYERGRVLKSIVVALQAQISFAEANGIPIEQKFPLLLSLLVSQRPNVYAEAINAFSDFRTLIIKVIYDEFHGKSNGPTICDPEQNSSVSLTLRKAGGIVEEKLVPASLLQTTCILLSVWSDEKEKDKENMKYIESLVDALMLPAEAMKGDLQSRNKAGLASAINVETKELAMTVDSWIMLCKARNDGIGKRAARSAPEEFLGRLLLSSGLPRGSLLAMIDRISELGSASANMDSAYRNLLVPSASSEWDIGRVGSSDEIARRLLGRLSAYLRAGTLDERSSISFVQWLLKECHGASFLRSRPLKKARTTKSKLASIPPITSLAVLLQGPSVPANADSFGQPVNLSDLDDLMSTREARLPLLDAEKVLVTIEESFSQESPQQLHEALENYVAKLGDDAVPVQKVAMQLARQILELGNKPRWAVTAILRWLPLLSKEVETDELWSIIFAKQDDLLSLFLDELILLCVQSWSREHIIACTKWINTRNQEQLNGLSCPRISDFLVKTCKLSSAGSESGFDTALLDTNPVWGNSEAHAATIVHVCIAAAVQSANAEVVDGQRNFLPSWLTLLKLLGDRGKKQLIYLTESLIRFQSENPGTAGSDLLDAAILRLYLLHPSWMNVGSSPVRMALLRASETHVMTWKSWRCELDDSLDEAIEGLASGDPRASRVLAEHARKHPLLILRKTSAFIAIMEDDATVKGGGVDSRGAVHGRSLSGPAEAKIVGKLIQVHIKHWGFSFTEPLWNGILDIYMGIPKEVIFQSGLKLGFLDILNTLLRLLSVQLHLLTGEATPKLKSKFAEILSVFGQMNKPACRAWWATAIDGTEVRNVLVSCDLLSPQQAIDSLRSDS